MIWLFYCHMTVGILVELPCEHCAVGHPAEVTRNCLLDHASITSIKIEQ